MHVGANGPLAERVVEYLVGTTDPAPAVRVHWIGDRNPSDPGGFEVSYGPFDRLGNQARQDLHIVLIGRAAQCPHCRGSRVRVRGRNQHTVSPHSGLLVRKGFSPVDQLTRHHACVNHNDRQPGCSIIENQTLGSNRILDLGRVVLEETPVDQDREICRCNINRTSTGTKRGCRSRRLLYGSRRRPVRRLCASEETRLNTRTTLGRLIIICTGASSRFGIVPVGIRGY